MIQIPSETVQWLINYFLSLPMKDSEAIVNHLRALEPVNDETPVQS